MAVELTAGALYEGTGRRHCKNFLAKQGSAITYSPYGSEMVRQD